MIWRSLGCRLNGRVVTAGLVSAAALLSLVGAAAGQNPFPDDPDWVSADLRYSTGGAFADINGDGWLDLVVSSGNDMRHEQRGARRVG